MFRRRQRRIGTHPPVRIAFAKILGIENTTALRCLAVKRGPLDRIRVGILCQRHFTAGGVRTFFITVEPDTELFNPVAIPPVTQFAVIGLAATQGNIGIGFAERRTDSGDIATMTVQEINFAETMISQ